ncbi:DUF1120 domain-containing protein [Enterobacter sp. MGH 16]|uniref:DUF1120 domain-containing protein n=1 Tax=Enterobacter cloacae complex TaxID=354276 RepID=UPI0003BFB073|nr:DUF1120 domain-containing protein [Enterobacter sp. MGH 16]ESN53173.1 hypothetical protein L362_00070 [Enterobacter sp. MGH 16]
MKHTACKTLIAVALALTANQAMAAGDSIDVKVIGKIVPSACTVAVSGGAVFDYGTIKAETLATDDYTMLGVKTANLSVSCEAPTQVALTVSDMRADSVAALTGKKWAANGGTVDASGVTSGLGLGDSNGAHIGAWAMWMEPGSVKADGNTVTTIVASKPTITGDWEAPSSGTFWLAQTIYYRSWAAPGTLTPVALTTLTGTLSVQAAINKGSELDLTQSITLDGLANIQIYYI